MPHSQPLHTTGGSTPVPDPTERSVAALMHEVAAIKELYDMRLDAMDKAQALFEGNLTRVPTEVDKQIAHLKELHDRRFEQVDVEINSRATMVGTRIDGMDKAVELLQAIYDKLPFTIDEKIQALKELHEEKFTSIQTQFTERDVRAEQTIKDSKTSVDAALTAAKEAVAEQNKTNSLSINKSEAATTRQIEQQGTLITSATSALNDKIEDARQRLTRIESRGEGASTNQTQRQASGNYVVGVIGVVLGALMAYGAWHGAQTPQIVYQVPPGVSLSPGSPMAQK